MLKKGKEKERKKTPKTNQTLNLTITKMKEASENIEFLLRCN